MVFVCKENISSRIVIDSRRFRLRTFQMISESLSSESGPMPGQTLRFKPVFKSLSWTSVGLKSGGSVHLYKRELVIGLH